MTVKRAYLRDQSIDVLIAFVRLIALIKHLLCAVEILFLSRCKDLRVGYFLGFQDLTCLPTAQLVVLPLG